MPIGFIFQIATVLFCLTGCGQAPQGLATDLEAKPGIEAASDPAPGVSPLPIGVPTVSVTVYTHTRTEAPVNGWVNKTYAATGYCAVYADETYCWDDGVKTLDWTFNNFRYGPYTYTYWNMSRETAGFSHSGGALQADLMPVPRLVNTTLALNLEPGQLDEMVTVGTQTTVQCVDADHLLTCPNFQVALDQAPL